MAFCRCGDESDVYVYYGLDNHYHILLAKQRTKPNAPEYDHTMGGYFEWAEKNADLLFEPLPEYNGEMSWSFAKAYECRDFLFTLLDAGYKVPELVFERLLRAGHDKSSRN